MRISVNLATRPYVELRPFFVRLRIVMAVLLALSVGLSIGGHFLAQKLERAQVQMDDLRYRTIAAQEEKMHAEQRMRQPANAAVLERAHFLNRLFLAKSFSWTAVMMDLETVLPVGVQVTSIEPQVTPNGEVAIRMKVSGERDRAIQLVRNLERSRRFLQPRLSGESTQVHEKGANGQPVNPNAPVGTEFDILANYNPLPATEAYRFAKSSKDITAAPHAHAHVAAKGRYPQNGVVLPPAPAARPLMPRPTQGGKPR
jgi:type IV pilus assembly protein PilN